MTILIALVWLLIAHGAQPPVSDEDAVRAVIRDYYTAQEREDADAVLALWRADADSRPTREALSAVFASGDDRFTITFGAVRVSDGAAKVRLTSGREHTVLHNGSPVVIRTSASTAFDLARHGGAWKITLERPLSEAIADDLLAASPADLERLLENPDNVSLQVLHALQNRGSRLAMGQQFIEAQRVLEVALAAARAAHDKENEGSTLQNLANALYFQRDFDKAAEYYQQRLAIGRDMQDDESIVSALLGIATTQYARGDYTPALTAYSDALAMLEKTGPLATIASTLISVGNVRFVQAEYDASAASYRRAIALLEGGANTGAVSMARSGLGRVFTAQGDLAAALQMYTAVLDDARAQAQAGGRSDVAAPLESIGELQFRLGNVDQARSAFDEARKVSDARRDPVTAGRLLGKLGLTELLAGKFDQALTAYVESRQRFETARLADGVGRAWVGIGFSQAAREKFADAITAYQTAITIFEGEHLDEETGRACLGLSLAQSGAGDRDAALENANRARQIADAIANDELRWRSRVREGEALRALSRLDQAERSFQDAIALIQTLAQNAATSADTRSMLDESSTAWLGLAFTLAQRGDAAGALTAEEQRRAFVRQLYLAPFESDIVQGSTPADRDQERQTMRDVISARARLRAERSSRHPDAARIKELQELVATLVKTRADQQAALYARVPDLAGWRGQQALPQGSDLPALVPDGALVVEMLVDEDQTLMLSAARGEAGLEVASAFVRIERHDLVTTIEHALDAESLGGESEWRKRARPLADFIKPLAARLKGRDRVVILPDDILWRVPFEALDVEDGKGLASLADVTYATSLTTLAMQRRNVSPPSETPGRPTFAAIAAPALSTDLRAQLAIAAPGWTAPDADAGVAAAKTLASLYGETSKVVSGADATKAAAQSFMDTVDVLRITAPVQMNGANPLFSSVLLAPGTAGDDTGRWALREWFAGRGERGTRGQRGQRGTRILCFPDGSAFGGERPGAAMDALAWAAAAEGVSTLAVGRWPAAAFENDTMAASFHLSLSKSSSPVEALRAAMAAARAKNGDAPSQWDGLRLVGDGR